MKRQIKKGILISDSLLQRKAPFLRQFVLHILRQVPPLHARLAALHAKDFRMEHDLFLPGTVNALSPTASRILQQLTKRSGRRMGRG